MFDWWAPNPNLGQFFGVCQLGYQNSVPIFDKILQFPYPIPLVFTVICGWQCQTAENVRKNRENISWPQLFKSWIALSTGLITIQWVSIRETNCVIHWIVIYPVDSAIQLLNNWGLVCF